MRRAIRQATRWAVFVAVALLVVPQPSTADMTPEGLRAILEDVRAPFKSVYLEYEGTDVFTRKSHQRAFNTDDSGLKFIFTGRFVYRNDNAVWLERYIVDVGTDGTKKSVVAVLEDKRESLLQLSGRATPNGQISKPTPFNIDYSGSIGRLFCVDKLLRLLDLQDAPSRFRYEGREDVDDHPCDVVRFDYTLNPDLDPDRILSERFWIDLNRGGNVLKREMYKGEDLMSRLGSVELLPRLSSDGQKVWLPIHGVYENFVRVNGETGEQIFESDPPRIETYKVLASTIKVNGPYKDRFFAVDFPRGTPISDALRDREYEFGQDLREPPATADEAEKRLREYLADAEAHQNELKAASWSRGGGRGWLPYLTWSVPVLALGALVIISCYRWLHP